ncbi:MAG: DUF3102 domain-containing protein [Ruminococcaceae bacterium]|nr:DUF3102 domain-containing protein [Oscillospiraceae bacterium]
MSVVDISKINNVEDFPKRDEVATAQQDGLAVRDLDVVAAEINVIKQQTAGVIARSIFEIGKRLCEAKAMIGHGNWEAWLRDNVEYSETTARNLMRAYREMGGEQIDMLTGEAPCDVFETLNLSQMVALFPMPVQERAAFVKENDVASMSVREVEERVREAVAQERARADALEGELEKATEATERAENARQKWNEIAGDLQKEKDEAKLKHEAEVRKLKEKADKLQKELKALQDAPVQERIVYKEREDAPAPTENAPDSEVQARVDALVAQLDEVQGKLKAAEDKAALMAQKADARVQAVNFALREISDKLSVIGDAVDGIRGGTTGDGELADKLATSAAKGIKKMLEDFSWYKSTDIC